MRPLDEFWLDENLPGFTGPRRWCSWDGSLFNPNEHVHEFLNNILKKHRDEDLDDSIEYETACNNLRGKLVCVIKNPFSI